MSRQRNIDFDFKLFGAVAAKCFLANISKE